MTASELLFEDIYLIGEGGKPVFRGLNCAVNSRQFVLITARSGAKKSELLRVACGLTVPQSGRVLIDGQDITQLPRSRLLSLRAHIGVDIKDAGLLSNLTVFENIALPLRYHTAHTSTQLYACVERVVGDLNLSAVSAYNPAKLSQSQVRRAMLARALILEPALLLIDEPLSDQDELGREITINALSKYCKTGTTSVLCTSHHARDLFPLADEVMYLHDGRISSEQPDSRDSVTC